MYQQYELCVQEQQRELLAIMSNHWFREFAGRYRFPENYICFDIETSGIDPANDYICSIGHTIVRDGVIGPYSESYLNWPDHPGIDTTQLKNSLLRVQNIMESRGKPFHHTWERLQRDGKPPLQVLADYLDLFETAEERQEVVVAHNGWRFDIEFLQAHFHDWLGISYVFSSELVYDTGVAEKASQLRDEDDPFPTPGETMQQFSWRIGNLQRRGIFWALDGYCDKQYNLFKKAGLDPGEAHGAGADSLLLAHLVEEHRKLAESVGPIEESE